MAIKTEVIEIKGYSKNFWMVYIFESELSSNCIDKIQFEFKESALHVEETLHKIYELGVKEGKQSERINIINQLYSKNIDSNWLK